jgi:hypothetical protein
MSEVRRYVIVDDDGEIVNVCMWDGETRWEPPAGTSVMDVSSIAQAWRAEPGGRIVDGEARQRARREEEL